MPFSESADADQWYQFALSCVVNRILKCNNPIKVLEYKKNWIIDLFEIEVRLYFWAYYTNEQ